MINKIDIPEIKILREQFMIFLNDNYGHLKHKDVLSSEAFYPYRHDIGMSFEKVFVDENSLRKARELLEIEFTKLSRKNPKSDSYVYLRAFKILKKCDWGQTYTFDIGCRLKIPEITKEPSCFRSVKSLSKTGKGFCRERKKQGPMEEIGPCRYKGDHLCFVAKSQW